VVVAVTAEAAAEPAAKVGAAATPMMAVTVKMVTEATEEPATAADKAFAAVGQ
jgi:hypothetical protein